MFVVAGLGNPGTAYADTYHNVGFHVVDRLALKARTSLNVKAGPAVRSPVIRLGGQEAVLLKPLTYMNLSGDALPPVMAEFGVAPEGLIVVTDDLALPAGRIRIRQKGSAGGHNGLKSVISALGSDEFFRVRVGIAPADLPDRVRDFVLSEIRRDGRELLGQAEELACGAVEFLIANGIEKAMAQFNGVDLRKGSEDN